MTFPEWTAITRVTDEQLAKQLGVHRATITHLRLGTQRPSLKLAAAIERYTSGAVSAASFVNGNDDVAETRVDCTRDGIDGGAAQ